MFYKIGFWVLLAIVLVCAGMFMKTNPMKNNGAMSWVEVYSKDPTATLSFLKNNFDISVTQTTPMPMGGNYNVVKSKGAMWPFGGVMGIPAAAKGVPQIPAGTMMYLTVTDYAEYATKIKASGAKPIMEDMYAEGMEFGVYEIPGGVRIGIAQYNVKAPAK